MSLQTWEELLYATIANGTQISNSTTETIMVPDFSLPSKYWYPGRTIRATLLGQMSNVVTTPGTLTLRARLGGVGGTVLAASDALALSTTARTNAGIEIQFTFVCRINGISATAGSMMTHGKALLGLSASSSGRADVIPGSGNAVVASLDLYSATTLSLTAQFSVATNPTNLTINSALYEALS